MFTCRRGVYWSAEIAVIDNDRWRRRIVAVYQDEGSEGSIHAELRYIISILERQNDFPPDDLDSLGFPLSSGPLTEQGLGDMGHWLGLSESVCGRLSTLVKLLAQIHI